MKKRITWLLGFLIGAALIFFVLPRTQWGAKSFATFSQILDAIHGGAGRQIRSCFILTFVRFLGAGIAGCLFGLILGTARASSGLFRSMSASWVDVARVTPAIVWIPVLYPLGATSEWIPFILGALYASLFLSLEVEGQLRQIDEDERTFLAAQNQKWQYRFRYCYFSRLVAGLAIGARLGLSVALILVIVGEALTGVDGLGKLLTSYMTVRATGELWSTILVIGALSLISFSFLGKLADLAGAEK